MKLKNIVILVMAFAMISAICLTAYAANGLGISYTAKLNQDEINVSDADQTVTVTVNANQEFTWDGIGFKVVYEAPLVLVDIVNTDRTLTGAEKTTNLTSGSNGAGFMSESGENETLTNICVLTFTVPAGTEAGEYDIAIEQLEITKDYGEIWESGGVVSTTLTIKAATPAHTCSVDTLTKTEESPADCTTDGVKAYWTCSCGKIYADAAATVEIPDLNAWKTGDGKISASHKYGELIQATEAIHTATKLKPAVAAHYLCACGKYFDDNKVETTLAALTGETPEHTHNKYDDINATTHQSYCACGAKVGEAKAHDYSYDATNHKCDCGEVERFVITMEANGGKFSNGAPVYAVDEQYGVLFDAVPSDPTKENCKFIGWNTKADGSGDSFVLTPDTWKVTGNLTIYAQWCDHATTTTVNNNDGTHDITCTTVKCGEVIADNEPHNYKTGYTCVCGAKFTGWDGDVYVVDAVVQKTGWTKIDDAWYYLDTATGERATDVARVPYNATLGYAPDQETLDYCDDKGTGFIDKETALFVFDEETGKFQSTMTGFVTYLNTTRYVEDGLLVWNPGFVTVGGELYYFIGDKVNGGNMPAQGKTYVVRPNDVEGYTKGDIVYFNNGKPVENDGIVDGYYYENGKIAYGKGVVEMTDENDNTYYIYVRSNGQLATGVYWPTIRNGLLDRGAYDWGTDGKYYPAEKLNGIVDIEGELYYYVDGKIAYGEGVVELADENDDTYYIYVRSNGQLATGIYWPTTRNDLLDRGAYDWGTDGKYYPAN